MNFEKYPRQQRQKSYNRSSNFNFLIPDQNVEMAFSKVQHAPISDIFKTLIMHL
jgi:hypothetical protein